MSESKSRHQGSLLIFLWCIENVIRFKNRRNVSSSLQTKLASKAKGSVFMDSRYWT